MHVSHFLHLCGLRCIPCICGNSFRIHHVSGKLFSSNVQRQMCSPCTQPLFQHGSGITARLESLLRSFANEQILLIGAQETRSKLDGHRVVDDFHILSAPATDKGVGGCQLWIRRCWPTTDGTLRILQADLRILHASAQRLIVQIDKQDLRLILISAHAPSCASPEVTTAWWSATTNAIPSTKRHWPVIALLDANARLGSNVSHCVGPHGADQENVAGECFHQWLHDLDLVVPQTFEAFHTGAHCTWTHSTGAEARLDYVALSRCLLSDEVRTGIADVDLSISKVDHASVACSFPITCLLAATGHVETANESAESYHDEFPDVPWATNVHDHAALLQRWMQDHCQVRRQVARKRKQHLTQRTWQLIQWKRHHWQRCRQLRSAQRVGVIRAVFNAWRSPSSPPLDFRPWMRLSDHSLALHAWRHHQLCLEVVACVRQDDKNYYTELAQSQGDVAADEGMNGLWKKIRHLLPKMVSKTRSNIRCRGPTGDELTEHYCHLEAGKLTSYDGLLQRCLQRQIASLEDQPLQIALDALPTRIEVETICRKAKRGRAPGLDHVPIDDLQQFMFHQSAGFHLLLFKAWTVASEPVQFKGGVLHSIAKKSGSTQAAHMRGIMLLDGIGKVYHALVRAKLLPWALQQRLPTQFGGFQGQQPAFASLLLRSFMSFAAHKKVSTAVIFVDVRSAFHCLLRQHAFGTTTSFPAALRETLISEGFDIEELLAQVQNHSHAFTSQVGASLVRVTQDAHQSTWFVCPQSPDCFETARGSRPGSPLADLAYNILMSSLLKKLQSLIHHLPALQDAHAFLEIVAPVIAWVDDIAIPISCLQASQLDDLLVTVMEQLHILFGNFGLRINSDKGKTEAIINYRGPAAAQLRRQRFVDDFGVISVPGRDPLRIVTQYLHLGIAVGQCCDIKMDVKAKIGKASNAFRMLSKPIFSNKKLPVAVRLRLLESLVLPIVFYGAGSWPLLSARTFATLSAVIVRWQRRIIGDGFWSKEQSTDQELRAHWKLPDLAVRLAKHRLLFLLQIRRHGPSIVWDFVTAADLSTTHDMA